jgi:hypothetical protein
VERRSTPWNKLAAVVQFTRASLGTTVVGQIITTPRSRNAVKMLISSPEKIHVPVISEISIYIGVYSLEF